MSVFHRIDDIFELDGPTLWRLAWRLPHYRGCMRDVVERLQNDEAPQPPRSVTEPARMPPIEASAAVLQAHPAFAAADTFGPVFEITEVKAT